MRCVGVFREGGGARACVWENKLSAYVREEGKGIQDGVWPFIHRQRCFYMPDLGLPG